MSVNISDDFLNDFEEELQQFYFDVIRDEKDVRKVWHVVGIRRALKDISQYLSHIRYDNASKRCAYMLKHGPLLSSTVAKYFHQVIQNNNHLLRKALSRVRLAICCLSGGPASDAVAIIRVIRALYHPQWQRTRKALKIRVTVVDNSEDWRITAKNALQCLEDTPRFFGLNEIDLSFEFCQADLTNDMSEEMISNIKKADIVSMVSFLSTVSPSKSKDKSVFVIEKIMQTMKKDSVLLFMNSAANYHHKLQNAVTEKNKTIINIFGPLVDEFQTLSIDSVKECLDLYSEHFYRYMCMTDGFVSVSAWHKPESFEIKHMHRIVQNKRPPRKTTANEEKLELKAKIKAYRRIVQREIDIIYDSSKWQSRFNHGNMNDVLPVTEKCLEQNSQQNRTKEYSSNSENNVNHLPKYLPQIKPHSKEKVKKNNECYSRNHLKEEKQNYHTNEQEENIMNAKENIPTASEVVFCIEKVISWMKKQSESNDAHLLHLIDMKQYANKKHFASRH